MEKQIEQEIAARKQAVIERKKASKKENIKPENGKRSQSTPHGVERILFPGPSPSSISSSPEKIRIENKRYQQNDIDDENDEFEYEKRKTQEPILMESDEDENEDDEDDLDNEEENEEEEKEDMKEEELPASAITPTTDSLLKQSFRHSIRKKRNKEVDADLKYLKRMQKNERYFDLHKPEFADPMKQVRNRNNLFHLSEKEFSNKTADLFGYVFFRNDSESKSKNNSESSNQLIRYSSSLDVLRNKEKREKLNQVLLESFELTSLLSNQFNDLSSTTTPRESKKKENKSAVS